MTTCIQCAQPATVQCTVCRQGICGEHTYMGHPLITARQLVTTTVNTAVRAPALLNDLLFRELDKVPYCPECREEVAARRQSEQLKLMGGLLLILLLVVGLPVLLLAI